MRVEALGSVESLVRCTMHGSFSVRTYDLWAHSNVLCVFACDFIE